MEPKQFSALAAEVYGRFGWASKIADAHGVHRSTVCRWGAGDLPIPQIAIDRLREAAVKKIASVATTLAG